MAVMQNDMAAPQNTMPVPEPVDEPVFITDCAAGLSDSEVAERIAAGKVNGDMDVKTKTVGQIFRENIISFFNLVFVILAAIQCFFVDWKGDFIGSVSKFGFMGLVIINTAIGIFQELRAKRTIDKLSLISAPKVHVIRNSQEKDIAVKEIVLDDMMLLSNGCQICADAVIAEGSVEVNESLITGEPDAIHKCVGDKVMSGSFVVSGNAKAQVEHVGSDNFATKISEGAKYFKKPNSEIWRSLMLIVKVMAAIIVPLGIALFCVKYLVQPSSVLNGGADTLDKTVQTVIGTVVGMIPSGLVALSSTVFCVSVVRLARRKTLAQDLYCVETLARVDVLCLDKTGTITEGAMDVNEIYPLSDINEKDVKQIIRNFTAALGDDNATSTALKAYAGELEVSKTATNIVPFSSQRKWSGARMDGVSYVLGAPEFVLGKLNKKLAKISTDLTEKGFRVIVLASSTADFVDEQLPKRITPLCFIAITDRIRKEAPDTLRFFKEEGVTVKIISGDNPVTVRAVAMRAGLTDCDNIVDMSTLQTDEEIYDAAEKYTIFGRVLPDQKLTLVKALKSKGHTVAMTGDGVNDVLALKAADCSVAMASGSDAAKNVSSIVLLDSNFASMPKVVAEGRRSINNLERAAALYLMKTIYNTLLAILFMFISQSLPFTTQNLTLMGGVTIGLPSIVLALEPNKERVKGSFLPKVLSSALPGGFAVLLAASAVILAHKFFLAGLTDSQATQLFIITISFVGFMMLAKVSYPFSLLHIVTIASMIALFVMCYVVPTPNDFILRIFGLDNDITLNMGMALLAICAMLLPIYIGLVLLMNVIDKKHGKYWDNKFAAIDRRLRSAQQKKH